MMYGKNKSGKSSKGKSATAKVKGKAKGSAPKGTYIRPQSK